MFFIKIYLFYGAEGEVDSFRNLVGMVRLELTHLSAPEPKSGAATNYATFPIKSKNPLPEKYRSLNSG